MMKFRVSDHSGISMNDSTSSTVNLTSKYLPKMSSSRRHSLIVEDTGRFHCRRSSAPADAFLSISDNDNSGVECVRYSKRVIDKDEDIESDLEYLGQTSASFVFKQNDENSYRGFSNFDEIILNDQDQPRIDAERFETVSDSGMGSCTSSSLSSHYFKLRPLQTVSDLTDLGFQTWLPKNFSLSHLRKRRSFEVQSGRPICSRYKWRFGYFQLVLAYVSFSLGMRPIVEAESPSGAFFVAHAVLMVGVGLPLSYLLSVIAQFSGGGCLQVWKMVPAAWGIGLAVLVTMLINAAINAVTVAYAFYYFIFVLRSYLPWEHCNPIYAADNQCQVAEFCYNGGQLCQSEDRSAKPTFQFWRHYVNSDDNGNTVYQSYGYPKWDLLIGLYLCWLLVTLMTCKGMKTLSKIICLLSILALLLFVVLLCLNHELFKTSTYIKMFAFQPSGEILSLDLWSKAAWFSAKSMAYSIGVLTCLSSYNKAEIRPAKMVSLVIFANLIITWMSLLLCTVYGMQTTSHSLSQEDHIFDLFMDEMNAPARAGVFIVFIIICKLNAIAILTDSVISSLTDSLSWMANYRVLTFVTYCFASFSLGLFFIVPNGYQLVENTRYSTEAASLLLLPLMVLTILYGYGLQRLSDNIYVMTGSSLLGLSKLWLSAFLPGSLVPIMVSYFHHSKFDYSTPANLHVYGLMLMLVVLPLAYATWLTSRALCKCDSIKALFTATPGWPQETQSKYAHTASFERYVNNRLIKTQDLAMNEF